jgi:hypothetical protein
MGAFFRNGNRSGTETGDEPGNIPRKRPPLDLPTCSSTVAPAFFRLPAIRSSSVIFANALKPGSDLTFLIASNFAFNAADSASSSPENGRQCATLTRHCHCTLHQSTRLPLRSVSRVPPRRSNPGGGTYMKFTGCRSMSRMAWGSPPAALINCAFHGMERGHTCHKPNTCKENTTNPLLLALINGFLELFDGLGRAFLLLFFLATNNSEISGNQRPVPAQHSLPNLLLRDVYLLLRPLVAGVKALLQKELECGASHGKSETTRNATHTRCLSSQFRWTVVRLGVS